MFDGLKRLWGRIVSMFNYTTLKNIIGKDVALSQTMIDAINEWKRMLVGNADWCDDDTVESLKLEEGICREFADSALVELEAKILNNDKMDKVLQKGLSDINKKLQIGLALGAIVCSDRLVRTKLNMLLQINSFRLVLMITESQMILLFWL